MWTDGAIGSSRNGTQMTELREQMYVNERAFVEQQSLLGSLRKNVQRLQTEYLKLTFKTVDQASKIASQTKALQRSKEHYTSFRLEVATAKTEIADLRATFQALVQRMTAAEEQIDESERKHIELRKEVAHVRSLQHEIEVALLQLRKSHEETAKTEATLLARALLLALTVLSEKQRDPALTSAGFDERQRFILSVLHDEALFDAPDKFYHYHKDPRVFHSSRAHVCAVLNAALPASEADVVCALIPKLEELGLEFHED